MLDLLRQMAAIVSDFYQKLGHVLVVLLLFPPKSSIQQH
jgi:hypothetical protein